MCNDMELEFRSMCNDRELELRSMCNDRELELRSMCNDRATDLTNEESGLDLLQGKTVCLLQNVQTECGGPTELPIKFLGCKAVGTRS